MKKEKKKRKDKKKKKGAICIKIQAHAKKVEKWKLQYGQNKPNRGLSNPKIYGSKRPQRPFEKAKKSLELGFCPICSESKICCPLKVQMR